MNIWFQIERFSNNCCQLNPGNLPGGNNKKKIRYQVIVDYFLGSEERSDKLR